MNLAPVISHYLTPLHRFYFLGQQTSSVFLYTVNEQSRFWIRANTPDKYTVWEAWKLNCYLDTDYSVRNTDVIIDIGANIGTYTVWSSQKAKRGRVYAYEPDINNFVLLKRNIKENHCRNVEINRLAVSKKSGDITLFTQPESNNVNHSLYSDGYGEEVMVPSTTLEEIISDHDLKIVDVLKIDAEGAEYDILLNAKKKTLQKIQHIYLEYHDYIDHGHRVDELVTCLESAGFIVSRSRSFLNLKHILFSVGYLKAVRRINRKKS